MADESIIRVKDLAAGYAGAVVLKDVNFDVRLGEIFAILGGSGSGKTTLLKCMIGLLKPLRGAGVIDGTDIVNAEGEERLNLLRKIGVAYQNGALFGSMTVLTNVALPLEEFTDLPRRAIEMIAQMKLKAVGLQAAAYKMPSVSGGMQTRRHRPGWPWTRNSVSMSRRHWTPDIQPDRRVDPESVARLADTFVIVTHEAAQHFHCGTARYGR
jgi:phospholipid/cholesterol/gamma-HCH transport system ATP-binding protein